MRQVAVLGAGRVGTAIARVLHEAGYGVAVAGSGPASGIELVLAVVAPGVEARSSADAVADADLVVLSVPMRRYADLDPALLRGHLVVDAMNYWEPTDGHVEALTAAAARGTTTSEVVAEHLVGARVVKTLNHLGYHEIESDRREPGAADRRALAVAGDPDDAAVVAGVLDRVGFDAAWSGPLSGSAVLQPGGAAFGLPMRLADLRRLIVDRAA